MLALVQSGERHVMVCEGSTLVGIVSEHDLYRLSRLDMKEMLQRLSRCDSTAALAGVAATFRRQVVALFKQGMDADACTRLLSLFNDQLLHDCVSCIWVKPGWMKWKSAGCNLAAVAARRTH
jgi:CBS domain-containing protein